MSGKGGEVDAASNAAADDALGAQGHPRQRAGRR